MEIAVQVQENHVIVRPVGKIDSSVAEEFQQHLLAAIQAHPVPVVLDCTAIPHISSAGLRVLALAAKTLRQRAQRLQLRQPTPLVVSTLRLTNFTSFLDVVE
jgi:anti-anti-sigma factor